MKTEYDIPRLMDAVDRFSRVRILVVGDVMMDEFVWGTVSRISPEAPVPVVDVTNETRLLGGAANVINNIVSVGGMASLAGVVGRDRRGKDILRKLGKLGVDYQGMVQDADRPTTIKTRVVAHGQQVVRFDRESRQPLTTDLTGRILDNLRTQSELADAVVISDYGKGVVSRELMNGLQPLIAGGKIVTVDPKVSNFNLYKKVSVITPNHHEAAQGAGMVIDSEESLAATGRKIMGDLKCASVLITRGEQGMTLFEKNEPPRHIKTVAREVFDVTGAGDTVIAILTLGLAAGLSRFEASVLANFAAGLVVAEVGTSTVTADQLKNSVQNGGSRRVSHTD